VRDLAIEFMTISLEQAAEAAQLRGLKWVCAECGTANRPKILDCCACGKQRWVQLGLSTEQVRQLAKFIQQGGHGE
jgi:primosomal protein N'